MRIRLWLEASPALLMSWAFLACVLGCDGGAAAQEEAAVVYQSGLRHMKQGQPEQAAIDLRRAIELDPERAGAHFKLGKLLVYLSDVVVGTPTRNYPLLEEGSTALRTASEIEPRNAEYAYWAGSTEALLGRSTEAIRFLRRALDLDPTHGPACKRLAGVHADAGETELAVEWYEKAIRFLPEDADAWFRYGVQLETEEDVQGAREAYERALDIDWTVPRYHSKLATVLQRLGDVEGATREANECSEWAEFGRELRERLNEAEASPDDMEALIAVGELYRSARRYKTGLVWLRRALALDPSNERARSAVADTLAEQGSTDEGERR
jgi:tetratricopeptide (TPR) repeat protein